MPTVEKIMQTADDDPHAALRRLQRIKSADSSTAILALSLNHNSSHWVRTGAVRTLSNRLNDPVALEALERLAHEQEVYSVVVDCLCKRTDEPARLALFRIAELPHCAYLVTRRFCDRLFRDKAFRSRQDVVAYLMCALTTYSDDPHVRINALQGLRWSQNKGALSALAEHITDPNVDARGHAIQALGAFGDHTSLQALKDAEHLVRDAERSAWLVPAVRKLRRRLGIAQSP